MDSLKKDRAKEVILVNHNFKSNRRTLPIIDLNKEGQGDVMVEACLNHGFFYIDNTKGQIVDLKISKILKRKSKEFFNSVIQEKRKYDIKKSMSLAGYAGFDSMTDFVSHENETFFIHALSLFPSNIGNESTQIVFEPEISTYIEQCLKLNERIYTHLAPFLEMKNVRTPNGFLNNWQEGFQENLWTGRFIHYPSNGGIAAHNDVGLLTILNQDEIGGLQVWLEDHWIDVKPIPNTFVINIGEILHNWSSGLLKSTRHKVVNKNPTDRYSMTFLPLFDKTCEIQDYKTKEWKSPYRHLIERYYNIFKHLSEKVKNPIKELQNKNPQEIDEYHQKLFLSTINHISSN